MTIRIIVKDGECQGKIHKIGQVFIVERITLELRRIEKGDE